MKLAGVIVFGLMFVYGLKRESLGASIFWCGGSFLLGTAFLV